MTQSFTKMQKLFLEKIKSGEIKIPYNRNFWLSTGNTNVKLAIIENLSRKLNK